MDSNYLSDAAAAVAAAAGLGVAAGGFGSAAAADQLGDLDGGAPTAMGTVKVTEGEPLSEEAARIQRKLASQVRRAAGFIAAAACTATAAAAMSGFVERLYLGGRAPVCGVWRWLGEGERGARGKLGVSVARGRIISYQLHTVYHI